VIGAARSRLAQDSLAKNSFFISLSNASMGLLGFLFWILAAHLYPARAVGVATTLVTGAVLVGYVSQLGFNTTFVRYLPTSEEPDAEINTGLTMVLIAALVIGTLYIAFIPDFVPQLRSLRASWWETACVVVFLASGSVNLVTDSVFIAHRAAVYNFFVDGVLQTGIRLALPIVLVGLGAFGLYAAFGVGATAAVAASIALMMVRFSYRPAVQISRSALKRVVAFGAANYIGAVLSMIPVVCLPLFAVRDLGAATGGYFYLGLQAANLLYVGSFAASQSLFAEGAQRDARLGELALRSLRLQVLVLIPGAVALGLGAHWILYIFGPSYSAHGTANLQILAASTPVVILNYWTTALLRVRDRLVALVVSNAAWAAVTVAMVAATIHRGLIWAAISWAVGNLVSGTIGGAALLMHDRRRQPVVSTLVVSPVPDGRESHS